MRAAVAQIEAYDVPLEYARKSIPEIAQFLQESLTQRLTAYIIGLSDGRDIGRYARGERLPHKDGGLKLRMLYSLIMELSRQEDKETIQVWLIGKNPELKGKSVASALRENFSGSVDVVRTAAEKFIESGS